ncbi:DoxX family protein [Streptomyces sp. S3(2020)]|uniref:DoxX family protein n=1 Tax=Streptomyces sp. S3(2020) TaxID=2732044 RepID=UPI001488A6E6|nr:DoxX family protein [Streptomyces sp. S3(2020)]NNN29228.1 DoxX family protein [Streptomyces sp. S3(2020)]
MILTVPLACLIALVFGALGLAKALAVPKMRELAAEAGFSVGAYRRVGLLELAGVAGVALGPAVPPLGGLAGAGLLLLLVGAAVVHLRKGDPVARLAPAVVCAVLVVGYLVALFG